MEENKTKIYSGSPGEIQELEKESLDFLRQSIKTHRRDLSLNEENFNSKLDLNNEFLENDLENDLLIKTQPNLFQKLKSLPIDQQFGSMEAKYLSKNVCKTLKENYTENPNSELGSMYNIMRELTRKVQNEGTNSRNNKYCERVSER